MLDISKIVTMQWKRLVHDAAGDNLEATSLSVSSGKYIKLYVVTLVVIDHACDVICLGSGVLGLNLALSTLAAGV